MEPRSLKDLRALKRNYTKEYIGKNLIVNLNNYPNIDLVITHGDKKSWGFFAGERRLDCFGRGNSEAANIILKSTRFSLSDVENIIVISDNPEVKRVYENLFKELRDSFYSYTSWCYPQYVRAALALNPLLYTNINDALRNKSIEQWRCYSKKLMSVDPYSIKTKCKDYSASNIKDAFGLSFKYVLLLLKYDSSYATVVQLKELGYSPQEIDVYHHAFFDWNSLAETYFSNRNVVKYYCDLEETHRSSYRDYLRMKELLPDTISKDFPLMPKEENLKQWHDEAVNLYYRHQAEIQALRKKELNDKYINEFYPKASKLDFSNKDYIIFACKELSHLVTEGQVLHHCVGSYMDSVGNGKEYILFLRKKEDVEKPFYTIDVTPEGKVRQIHGFGNSNLPLELKPFIKEWAKKFNLDVSNCSGVYCALR